MKSYMSAKVRRRDGTLEMFDFYDTYNPRDNKVHKAKHVEWPVGANRPIGMLRSYQVKKHIFETRTPFLTELSPAI